MSGAGKIETGVARMAAVALGCAVGFAALSLLQPVATPVFRSLVAGGAAVAVCLGCNRLLARIGGRIPDYRLATFAPPTFESTAVDEPLELTEVHRTPLILDDVLHAVGPEARVVRLFERAAMPSPAELKARIDRHLGQGAAWAKSPDASQALVDALTELRRSLR